MTAEELLGLSIPGKKHELVDGIAPDLAVEVVSPSDRWTGVERKASLWLEAGTGAVLVVDAPLRSATVFRAQEKVARHRPGDRVELSDVVPGWRPVLDDLLS